MWPFRSHRVHVPRLASLQACLLDLQAVREDVLLLKGGDTRAAIEVAGMDLALKSPDEQEAILEGYRALLNGLDGPVQLVARSVPQDVQTYLDDLRAPEDRHETEALVRLRLDHFAFVQELASRRTLLHHRSFLVVAGPRVEHRSRIDGPFGLLRRLRGKESEEDHLSFDAARRQLTARADELGQGLQAIGLPSHRLGRDELLHLLHEVLAPQQAARQRGSIAVGPQSPVVRFGVSGREPHDAAAA